MYDYIIHTVCRKYPLMNYPITITIYNSNLLYINPMIIAQLSYAIYYISHKFYPPFVKHVVLLYLHINKEAPYYLEMVVATRVVKVERAVVSQYFTLNIQIFLAIKFMYFMP